MSKIASPGLMNFTDWVNDLNHSLKSFNIPLPPPSHLKWRHWVYEFIQINGVTNITLPKKEAFPKDEDWKKWALFFINDINRL